MTGGLTLLGVIYTVRKQHDVTVEELRFEIRTIKKEIKDLETKQDKHNKVVERVYELEKVAEVLEERQKTANHPQESHKNVKICLKVVPVTLVS